MVILPSAMALGKVTMSACTNGMRDGRETIMAQVATLLWVCTDCAFMLANGEAEGTTPEWQDAHAAGIERVLDGHYGSVVAGGEHHCGEPGEQDCDCEDGGFSHYECELCRSSLAGYRFAATVLYA